VGDSKLPLATRLVALAGTMVLACAAGSRAKASIKAVLRRLRIMGQPVELGMDTVSRQPLFSAAPL